MANQCFKTIAHSGKRQGVKRCVSYEGGCCFNGWFAFEECAAFFLNKQSSCIKKQIMIKQEDHSTAALDFK